MAAAKPSRQRQECSTEAAESCGLCSCPWVWLLQTTFGQAGLGALLLWLALPPVNAWPLVFVSPVSWILLIRRKQMPGRRPYRALYLVGFLFWFAVVHWIRMPHPATSLGWVALAVYLGCYLPLFVGLSRVAVHQLRVSVLLAAPAVWMGLELVRGHVFGGFTMASLGHVIYRWTAMIQTADLAGAAGVSAVVMFLVACLGRMVPVDDEQRWRPWPLVPAIAVLALCLGYGHVRMQSVVREPVLRVALIQGSVDIDMRKPDPGRNQRTHDQHMELTVQAVTENDGLDLIVWPETVFNHPLYTYDEGAAVPPDLPIPADEFRERLAAGAENSRLALSQSAELLRVDMLVGVTRVHYGAKGEAIYNSAALATAAGEFVGWYDKKHLVMFGEYFPLADHLTWLYDFTPVNTLGLGLQAGDEPVAFDLKKLRAAPNICFESVVPQVIRYQVTTLTAQGREPDVLINVSNDGWFRGSNELEMHMVCGVFRAVECRKPFLIAANTGISAWIDGDGRVRRRGPTRQTGIVVAEVSRDGRGSLYLWWGDLPAHVCLACCVVLAAVGLIQRRRQRHRAPNEQAQSNSSA